ncbi:hypothetical protein PM082_006709 [Marasmius tenuissimus]|nr:hypothetical protein PM082_006709 [Marasmius tenuissimus]
MEGVLMLKKSWPSIARTIWGDHKRLLLHRRIGVGKGFKYDPSNEEALVKKLVTQVRKTMGPFAAPKKIHIVPDLPKTRSGK